MHPALKSGLFVVLLGAAVFLGIRFGRSYAILGEKSAQRYSSSDLTNVRVPEVGRPAEPAQPAEAAKPGLSSNTVAAPKRTDASRATVAAQTTNAPPPAQSPPPAASSRDYARVMGYGGALFVIAVFLAFLVAREITQFVARHAGQILFNEEGEIYKDLEYDPAEQEWAKANYLEAIRLLREYYQKKPREIHAAIRIAEIYEKDLRNYLAAALEYEEILQKKFHPEHWGWAAIHLANLYSGRLNQQDKAVALLRRIDAEYTKTAAAEKARRRLAMMEANEAEAAPEEISGVGGPLEPAPEPPPTLNPFPPGFGPKKS